MQDPKIRAAIAAMGSSLGPDVLVQCQNLFRDEQARLAAEGVTPLPDQAYGDHPRQALDLYRPKGTAEPAPILVWVHGGGFVRGEKSAVAPFETHMGQFAARQGWLGAVMNYRLAPEHQWPSGGEDVGAAVDWLKANAARFGGDSDRILLAGTSAGAVHVATYLQLRAEAHREVVGAVLLSGLYTATGGEARDNVYYGDDASRHAERFPLAGVVNSQVPVFVAGAEFDPPRFQAEMLALLGAMLEKRGTLPRAHIASGQSHYSMAQHIGTSDTRLSDEIVAFARELFEG